MIGRKRVRDILDDGREVLAELDEGRRVGTEAETVVRIGSIRSQELGVAVEPRPGTRVLAEESTVARGIAIMSHVGIEAEAVNAIEVAGGSLP